MSAADQPAATTARRAVTWIGHGSPSIVPPADYWATIEGSRPGPQLERLRLLSDARVNEFRASDLPLPRATASELLDKVAADLWLSKIVRRRCPNCDCELTPAQANAVACPECLEAFSQHGGVFTETVYVRTLSPVRDVEWVVAIHGMNTTGAWQESFTWLFATTWGRSVPVAVYKYGIVVAGVLMAWRRRKLVQELRLKLKTLRDEARAHGFAGKPDVIAHSFGTWLFGHVLLSELERSAEERLVFGRVILTGCILRPDFNWARVRTAGLVDDVLNHYASRDAVVPAAHLTIWDSGPSGRRGFDGDQVHNICAQGYGHSDLFATTRCVVNGRAMQACSGADAERSHLQYSYMRYWRPFLTLPVEELTNIPDRLDPPTAWRALPWPFRGTLFPFVVLPLILTLLVLLEVLAGSALESYAKLAARISAIGVGGLALLLGGALAARALQKILTLRSTGPFRR